MTDEQRTLPCAKKAEGNTPDGFRKKRWTATGIAGIAAAGAILLLAIRVSDGYFNNFSRTIFVCVKLVGIGVGVALLVRLIVTVVLRGRARAGRVLRRVVLAIDLALVILILLVLALAALTPVLWDSTPYGSGVSIWFDGFGYTINVEVNYTNATRHDLMHDEGGWRYWHVRIPLAIVIPIAFVLTYAFWMDAVYRRFVWLCRRLPEGYCQSCAYDLRGNQSGICPECGLAVSESSARKRMQAK